MLINAIQNYYNNMHTNKVTKYHTSL